MEINMLLSLCKERQRGLAVKRPLGSQEVGGSNPTAAMW